MLFYDHQEFDLVSQDEIPEPAILCRNVLEADTDIIGVYIPNKISLPELITGCDNLMKFPNLLTLSLTVNFDISEDYLYRIVQCTKNIHHFQFFHRTLRDEDWRGLDCILEYKGLKSLYLRFPVSMKRYVSLGPHYTGHLEFSHENHEDPYETKFTSELVQFMNKVKNQTQEFKQIQQTNFETIRFNKDGYFEKKRENAVNTMETYVNKVRIEDFSYTYIAQLYLAPKRLNQPDYDQDSTKKKKKNYNCFSHLTECESLTLQLKELTLDHSQLRCWYDQETDAREEGLNFILLMPKLKKLTLIGYKQFNLSHEFSNNGIIPINHSIQELFCFGIKKRASSSFAIKFAFDFVLFCLRLDFLQVLHMESIQYFEVFLQNLFEDPLKMRHLEEIRIHVSNEGMTSSFISNRARIQLHDIKLLTLCEEQRIMTLSLNTQEKRKQLISIFNGLTHNSDPLQLLYHLPNSLFSSSICSFVTNGDLLNVAIVSKKFYNLLSAPTIWRKRTFLLYSPFITVPKLFYAIPNVQVKRACSLKFHFTNFHCIQSLSIVEEDSGCYGGNYEDICRWLRDFIGFSTINTIQYRLTWKFYDIISLLKEFPLLKTLIFLDQHKSDDFSNPDPGFSFEYDYKQLPQLPEVTTLDFSKIDFSKHEQFFHVIINMAKITPKLFTLCLPRFITRKTILQILETLTMDSFVLTVWRELIIRDVDKVIQLSTNPERTSQCDWLITSKYKRDELINHLRKSIALHSEDTYFDTLSGSDETSNYDSDLFARFSLEELRWRDLQYQMVTAVGIS